MILSIACLLTAVFAPHEATPARYLGLFVVVTLAMGAIAHQYRRRLQIAILDEVAACVGITAVAAMFVTSLQSLLSADAVFAENAVRLWLFAAVYVSAGRAGLLLAQKRSRQYGFAMERTLIIGAGNVGTLVWRRLKDHPELGFLPVGFLDKEPLNVAAQDPEMQVFGASWNLERVVEMHGIQQVVLAFSSAPHEVLLDLVARCERLGLDVSIVPRLFERMPSRVDVTHVGGLPLLHLRPANPRGLQYGIKYALDRVIAVTAIVLLLPVLAVISIAVLISLGRPILYKQRRVGLDGKPFMMIKFRSMLQAPEEHGEPAPRPNAETAPGGVEGVDRRTRVGAFLRKSSLDELPQLVNIARGEMTFVGPRPERPEFAEYFDENVYRYGERQRVKGGLTGWAQIHRLRGQTSLAERVEWDNYYIENFSLWLDVKIVLLTVPEVFRGTRE